MPWAKHGSGLHPEHATEASPPAPLPPVAPLTADPPLPEQLPVRHGAPPDPAVPPFPLAPAPPPNFEVVLLPQETASAKSATPVGTVTCNAKRARRMERPLDYGWTYSTALPSSSASNPLVRSCGHGRSRFFFLSADWGFCDA